jgi:hypothetical protein
MATPTPAVQVGAPLVRALGLSPAPEVPGWITDPAVRASIAEGFLDLPDDLRGQR